jgi:hypothetical protein
MQPDQRRQFGHGRGEAGGLLRLIRIIPGARGRIIPLERGPQELADQGVAFRVGILGQELLGQLRRLRQGLRLPGS